MIASGGPRNSVPGTLTQLFFEACEQYDSPHALRFKADGAYQSISHRALLDRVRRAALGLQELGVRAGDRVGLLSENRPEWAIADYACLTSCLTDVPIYPNSTPDQAAYILRDSGATHPHAVADTTDANGVASRQVVLRTAVLTGTRTGTQQVKVLVTVRERGQNVPGSPIEVVVPFDVRPAQ